MGTLGWFVAPALTLGSNDPVFTRLAVLTVGLVWQFALVMLLLYREARTWRWSMLRERLWLNAPRSPRTGETRARLWWWLVPVALLTAIFDLRVKGILFLGEELLFRGLLLPRMAGAFARADWVANGFLFGVYHLHQPWGIVSSVIHGTLLFALPSRCFRSAWFGITAHSGQSIFFAVLMFLLILGLG